MHSCHKTCALICHETFPMDHVNVCHIYEWHNSSIICVFMPHWSIRRVCVTRHARSIICIYITFMHDTNHQSCICITLMLHDSFTFMTWLDMCDINTCIYITSQSSVMYLYHIYVTWLIHMYHLCARHDSWLGVPNHSTTCATYVFMSNLCMTWIICHVFTSHLWHDMTCVI